MYFLSMNLFFLNHAGIQPIMSSNLTLQDILNAVQQQGEVLGMGVAIQEGGG